MGDCIYEQGIPLKTQAGPPFDEKSIPFPFVHFSGILDHTGHRFDAFLRDVLPEHVYGGNDVLLEGPLHVAVAGVRVLAIVAIKDGTDVRQQLPGAESQFHGSPVGP